jgi:hypothetical protein
VHNSRTCGKKRAARSRMAPAKSAPSRNRPTEVQKIRKRNTLTHTLLAPCGSVRRSLNGVPASRYPSRQGCSQPRHMASCWGTPRAWRRRQRRNREGPSLAELHVVCGFPLELHTMAPARLEIAKSRGAIRRESAVRSGGGVRIRMQVLKMVIFDRQPLPVP